MAASNDELERRIAELEGRLGGVDLAAVAETEPDRPMRDAYDVRSAITGAVVVSSLDLETSAEREAERLNASARRDGVRHRGEPMRYAVVATRVPVEPLAPELDDAEDEDA